MRLMLKSEHLKDDGVRLVMADEIGNAVACTVSPLCAMKAEP
jgi:hypothetical protein